MRTIRLALFRDRINSCVLDKKGVVDFLGSADRVVVTAGDSAYVVDTAAPGVERAEVGTARLI